MKKKKYSMTSKERKALRQEKQEKSEKKQAPAESQPEIDTLEAGEATVKKAPKRWVLIVSIALVVVLVISGVLVGFVLDELQKPNGNPIATMTLDNGMVIKLEIFETDAPIASTNFMFLALKGFFNNTIIHDNQNDWVRFSGYLSPEKHRSEDEAYCKSFTGFDKYDYAWSKAENRNIFWYRLNKDSNATAYNDYDYNEGMIGYQYSRSSSVFQISARHNASTHINGTNSASFTVFGRYADVKSLENIKLLNVYGTDPLKTTKKAPWFFINDVIKIKTVKITNYDKTKWKTILKEFDTYMEQIKGYSLHTSGFQSFS